MDPWKVYCAAVEAAEPGASRHCALGIYEGDTLVGYEHSRLGIRVRVRPEGPSRMVWRKVEEAWA